MGNEQEKLKQIFMGYHPRSQDGSSPKSRSLSDSIAIMEAFNEAQQEDRFRAEVVEIAFSDGCAVTVVETNIDKVWQYL
ncbi:hypothetical protein [uncultured Pseudodesulfovibrio sp.]|uniref:hypothetical protein n=1 Tax=uncultured Pseudodesulfovibrio sp. TaxID=2035858 RepID=UPI0029C75D97|nr:hypothetical protein [uncultured Pseudodesulfovibrio sp.]